MVKFSASSRAWISLTTASVGVVSRLDEAEWGDWERLTVESKAMALVPAVVLGQVVFEVVVRVFNRSNFVDLIDEIAL